MKINGRKVCITASCAAWLAATAAGQQVNAVTVKKGSTGVAVDVSGTRLGRPKLVAERGGKRFVFEFDARYAGKAKRLWVREGGVSNVFCGWYSVRPARVHVAVDTERHIHPVVAPSSDGWTITFGTPPTAAVCSSTDGTAFPTTVPPLVPASKIMASDASASSPAAAGVMPSPKPSPNEPTSTPLATVHRDLLDTPVSLDFTNTEVTQIIKALALQAGVNIVTSPEVKGPLSLSLRNVTVKKALDYIVAAAGLDYAHIGDSFVVVGHDNKASSEEHLQQVVERLMETGQIKPVTRVASVMPEYSNQIRQAVMQSLPCAGADGWYEIIGSSAPPSGSGAAPAATGGSSTPGALASNLQASGPAAAPSDPPQPFLVVVGDASRVSQAIADITRLNVQMQQAQSSSGADIKTVTMRVLSHDPSNIGDLLQRFIDMRADKDQFSLTGTTVTDGVGGEAQEVLILSGPHDQVNRLKAAAVALDDELCSAAGVSADRSPGANKAVFEAVDLKFIEPAIAAKELSDHFPKLTVTPISPAADPNTPPPAVSYSGNSSATGASSGASTSSGSTQTSSGSAAGGSPTTSTMPGSASGGPSNGTQSSGAQLTGEQQADANVKVFPFGLDPHLYPMRLMLHGNRREIERAKSYLAQIDVAPRQVELVVRVVELNKQDSLKAGMDWNVLTNGAVSSLTLNDSISGASNTGTGSITGRGFSIGLTATLDALAQKGKVISRPNLVAEDGHLSEVFIGETIPYFVSQPAAAGGQPTYTPQFLPVGVTLNMVPRISKDGRIMLGIDSDVSNLLAFVNGPNGSQAPETTDRKVTMNASLKDGQTLAIGGLIQNSDTLNTTKVPILGDLPLIGNLFRSTDREKNHDEVVIFITAKVIHGGAGSYLNGAQQSRITHPKTIKPGS